MLHCQCCYLLLCACSFTCVLRLLGTVGMMGMCLQGGNVVMGASDLLDAVKALIHSLADGNAARVVGACSEGLDAEKAAMQALLHGCSCLLMMSFHEELGM